MPIRPVGLELGLFRQGSDVSVRISVNVRTKVRFSFSGANLWLIQDGGNTVGFAGLQYLFLVHGQVTIIFVVSVCLFVCLFVQFFSAIFDPISIKLGHMLYVWV